MKTLTLILNECRLFFLTPLAAITAFGFYAVNGVLFWYLINQANMPGEQLDGQIMSYITGGIVFWMMSLVLIPIIAMRLVAFEHERGTLAHLFSAPVATWQIILGKFFGGYFFYMALWLPTLFYPVLLSFYTPLDWGPVFATYLGLFLVGAFLLSVGVAASCLGRSQISAAILCFCSLLTLLLLSMFETLMPSGFTQEIFQYLNFIDHLTPFTEGLIDTRDVVFFLISTVFFLITANEILSHRRSHYA